MNLDNISTTIREQLNVFEQQFQRTITLEGFFIDDIIKYVINIQGKQIRPILTLLSAKLAGGVTEQTMRCAIITELLHTASLIHDDVIDRSDKRRGEKSVNKLWGNNTAVLFGDYLYGKAIEVLKAKEDVEIIPFLAKIGSSLPLGELLQKDISEKLAFDEESYFKVIENKTASMMEVCATIGAISAKADEKTIKSLKEFGNCLGLIFQIRDDILDIMPKKDEGKPFANDIKEKKITLPLIYLLNDIEDEKEREEILNFIGSDNKKEEDILSLIDRIIQSGYVEKANILLKELAIKAKNKLVNFDNNDKSKQALISLVDVLVYNN
ncbi:MAG: polyprenyl synthetase family protein [Bacteroidales bacterium]|jgi:octaprenyl-diphosphate synthase|nr:polyprenyl synthetase family protein [Bacteroidales bacterium]